MIRRVIECPELLIPKLFVEAARLEAERVEPSRVAATIKSPSFDLGHQLAPYSSPTKILANPEVFDEQPSGIRFAGKTGSNGSCVADKNTERLPSLVIGPSAFVECLQNAWKKL